MAVIVHSAQDIQPFIGKTISRVSMSAYDIGLHCAQDSAFLIEAPWSLQDKKGQEHDRNFGIKIRKSASLIRLVGQTLRKMEAGDSFLLLTFDEHCLRISLLANPYRSVNTGVLGGFTTSPRAFRWDPVELTAPGYLLDKKKKKKAPVYKLRGARKDPEDLSFLCGKLVSRVSWSAEDAGIYFQGQQRILVECPWSLMDATGRELDRSAPLKDRQETTLFRLIGIALMAVEKWPAGMRFCFEEGLRLTVTYLPAR